MEIEKTIMKKYIGTRQIEAEPMTLGGFVQKTGRNPLW